MLYSFSQKTVDLLYLITWSLRLQQSPGTSCPPSQTLPLNTSHLSFDIQSQYIELIGLMMPIVFYLQGKLKLHQTGGFAASSPSAGGGA